MSVYKTNYIYYLFPIFFSLPFLSIAQINLDSLYTDYKNTSLPAKQRISACVDLGMHYAYKNADSTLYYQEEAATIARVSGDDSLIVVSLLNFGYYYVGHGNYEKALDSLNKGLTISKKMTHPPYLPQIYRATGDVKFKMGNSVEGLEYLQKSLDLYKSQNDTVGQADVEFSLGGVYFEQQDLDKAAIHMKLAKELYKKAGDIQSYILCIGNLGNIADKDPDKALPYFKEVAHLADSIGATSISAAAFTSIGRMHREKNNFKQAKIDLTKSLELFEKVGSEYGKKDVELNLGLLHLKMKDYKKGIQFCSKTYDFYNKSKALAQTTHSCKCLYKCYEGNGDFRNALDYSLEFKTLSDSMFSQEKTKELTETELKYDFDKEKELLAFQKEKDEEILIAKNNQTRTAAFGIGGLALLAIGFFFNARRKNQLISAQKEQLESLNHTKDRIFAIIGHDLRKPAASFRGISKKVKYLIKNKDFETLDKYGQQIEQNALSLNKLTDNLLNWALTQRDVMPYNPATINLNDIALDIQTIFSTPASEKNIEIINNVPQGIKVYADPNALTTIMTNLVDNAIKYTPEGGQVRIEALEEADNQLKIRVSDTGIGMHQDKINDLFLLQKDKSEKGTAGEKGTGLGLHLVKELVELNKGIISAASEIGKGTSFEVLLPRLQAA